MRVNHLSTLSATLLVLIAAGVLINRALAQVKGPERPNSSPEQPANTTDPGIRMDVELALANVTVTDRSDRPVSGLEKEKFRVFEDGVEQEVNTFSNEDVPISIGLIFDMSGSMSDKVDNARQAAAEFFRAANPRDEFLLVSVNDRAELVSAFTSSVEEIQNRMMYTVAKGRTALLDGIYLALGQMRRAKYAKRALLIISDGGDNYSRHSENDIRNALKEADCQVYAVGIFDANGFMRSPEEFYGPRLLDALGKMSGGGLFPIYRISDLPDAAEKIGAELRHQYVLGYRPSNTQHDGTWRKIKVTLNVPKGTPRLNVYAKTGYYAPHQ
jgi:Ca-activated chloride channel family protein